MNIFFQSIDDSASSLHSFPYFRSARIILNHALSTMRFWQAITYLLTTLTLANAAAVDSSRFDTSPNDLGKRQVVGANVCATVGPLTVPNILGILPPITVISVSTGGMKSI